MKKTTLTLLTFITLAYSMTAFAQKNLAIIDKARFMNGEIEKILSERLKADSVNLTSIIDTRKRCEYLFANIEMAGPELQVSLADCNDRIAGTKNLGSKIMTAADPEKALILYFALSELIRQPFKSKELQKSEDSSTAEQTAPGPVNPGHHRSRYFFAPSSYNLEKGEIYYNSLYFLIHDVQYGVTNNFSMGMGTTIIGFPFYLTPKFTIPVNEKNAFAVGDMLMFGTYGTKFTGNLLYSTFTTGGDYNNITVGAGYLYAGGGDISDPANALLLNISALARISDHVYFITENYGTNFSTEQIASSYDYNTGTGFSSEFKQNVFFIYGLTGFRFINRSRDIKSWQFGLSYVFTSRGEAPDMYKYSNWFVENRGGNHIIAFPVIGFARKFSARY